MPANNANYSNKHWLLFGSFALFAGTIFGYSVVGAYSEVTRMKLIIIHGPPAAGKLTIANAIAERSTFKVFHNHMTIDCAKPVFDFGTPAFWRIVLELRLKVIAEAAREKIDIVHTFCYAKGDDDV